MKFLIDKSRGVVIQKDASNLVLGQLITPLTSYNHWGGVFAIDNGAYTCFDGKKFARILARETPNQAQCLFVTVPDIVGSARRTLEIYRYKERFIPHGWIPALVAQDGLENLDVPWDDIRVLFLGGRDPWKDSQSAQDLVRTAKVLGCHVHIGRVNTPKRFELYHGLGADTCDGSGVSMYDHMLLEIERHLAAEPEPTIFDLLEENATG